MKLILAIIQPAKLEAVKEALSKVEVFRLTIVDVQGFGRQKGHAEVYRGHELTVNLLRKVQLQIAVNEDFVEPTVNAIMEAGRASSLTARTWTPPRSAPHGRPAAMSCCRAASSSRSCRPPYPPGSPLRPEGVSREDRGDGRSPLGHPPRRRRRYPPARRGTF